MGTSRVHLRPFGLKGKRVAAQRALYKRIMGASWVHLCPSSLKGKRLMVIVAAQWALKRRTMGASRVHLRPFGLKRKRLMVMATLSGRLIGAQWAHRGCTCVPSVWNENG